MLVAILGALLLATGAVGWGHGLWSCLRFVAGKPRDELPIGVLGLMGLFAIANLAVVYNFFSALDAVFSGSMLSIGGLLALHLCTRSNTTDLRTRAAVMGMLVAAFALAAVATTPGYDAGLYHLPYQLWMRSEKIVLGLANLHGRFGFNSILEPLMASAWLPPHDLAMAQMVPALIKAFFFSTLYEEVKFGRRKERSSVYLALVLIAGYVLARWMLRLASESWAGTDTWTGLVLLLGYYYCLVALNGRNNSDLWVGIFFILFASEMKVSSAFALPVALVAALWTLRQSGLRALPLTETAALSLCFLPWLLRNILLSGCVVYPATLSCLPGLPWSAAGAAAVDLSWTKAWARAPNTGLVHLHGWAWLPIWLENKTVFFVNAAIILCGLTTAAIFVGGRSTNAGWSWQLASAISVCGILPLVAWFFSAPDLRFAFAHIVMFLVLPGFLFLAMRETYEPVRIREFALILFLVLPWVLTTQQAIDKFDWYRTYPMIQHRALILEPPAVVQGDYFGTRPSVGDQCWLATPGCTPDQRRIVEERRWGFRMFRAEGS
jgi:hypothetical protein